MSGNRNERGNTYVDWSRHFLGTARLALGLPFLRKLLLAYGERKLRRIMVDDNPEVRSRAAKEESYYMVRAVLRSVARALDADVISDRVKEKILRVFILDVLLGDAPRRRAYIERYGYAPPTFVTVSPYKGCNLRCKGCYAASEGKHDNTLPYSTVRRILDQAMELWGARFFVISGGEPLLYRSEGKGVLDLFEAYPECYFLMYTNGTLIDDEAAARLEAAGNATPALSFEGYEAETDARRGKGVYRRILSAVERLQRAGVPYGFSGTVTRENAPLFLEDRLVETYFHELKGVYMWLFHYMPIGRDVLVDLQPTPEQRKALFLKQREWIRRGYFLVDFWNAGIVTDGCICAGRPGGYFYIDWDGNATPCVFIPYAAGNVKEVFARGGNLNDLLQAGFMKELRAWQRNYSYLRPSVPEIGNQITCCPTRDHYRTFREILERNGARPTDENARRALEDPGYGARMEAYDRAIKEITDPVWEEEYLREDGAERKKRGWLPFLRRAAV